MEDQMVQISTLNKERVEDVEPCKPSHTLDDSLEKQMYMNTDRLDSFIVCWMNLMSIVESISINRFDGIKAKLKSRNVGQYPGQNIVMLCSDYLSDYTDLDNTSMYDFTLTMHMLQKIMEHNFVK